jgi:hypothetical protein
MLSLFASLQRTCFIVLCCLASPAYSQPAKQDRDYASFFPTGACSKQAFALATRGYYVLRQRGLLPNSRYLTIIDFTKKSNQPRLFVLDMKQRRLALATITAHGSGSDPDSLTIPYRFSNRNGSRMSSIGFYVTGSTYFNHRPQDSLGLCLFGLDKGYNDSAAAREIVVHYGATEYAGRVYVTDAGAARSSGCPALPLSTNSKVINLIKEGSCLFIYSDKENLYEAKSTILNGGIRDTIIQRGPPPNNCACRIIPPGK